MRGIMVVLVSIGLSWSLGQAQSIPQDVALIKKEIARINEELKKLGVKPSPAPGITREQVAVYNRSERVVVLIKPHPLGHGLVQVGDTEGRAGVELMGRDTGGGFVRVNGFKTHDYAEIFELATRHGIRAGSVVAYDSGAAGLVPASVGNARHVIGVVSGAGGLSPGMVIGSRKDGSRDFPVSMSGVIYVRVSGESGPVEPGDLLVPSSVAGVGMRARDRLSAAGTVFGKALEPWSKAGEGLVLMLVMNR